MIFQNLLKYNNMCGISIAISKLNTRNLHNYIEKMNSMIIHRGPDDEGYYYGDNFAFGHRRLSIIDLTNAGHQPFNRNHLWITYNGEVYNYVELRDELMLLGYSFKTLTDTEVILAAYEQWGVNAFSKFNGMWAFAVFDSKNNEIVFSRDHFGIKPLFYTHTTSFFLAGSEIKQFTTFKEFEPILNKKSVINFLTKEALNFSENTFFEGVYELPAGYYLNYNLSDHSIRKIKWYDIKEEIQITNLSDQEAIKQFRKLFDESIKIRMRSDVAIGSCLSGGIDSSAIVSIVKTNNLANDSFATVTSCFKDKKYDEQHYSDLVTNSTRFKSIKVYPKLNDLFEKNILDKIIFHQDQPVYSGSCFSEYSVFETAKKNNLTVMLDGQGSDEYLCGYGEFYILKLKQLISKLKFKSAFILLREKSIHRNHNIISEFRLFFNSAYYFPLIDLAKSIFSKNKFPWLTKEWNQIAKDQIVKYNSRNVKDLSIEEIKYTSIPYQLHSEDRNSMMFSIESRLPFLCPRLVEFSIGLSDNFKIRNGYTKFILREAVPELPEAIRDRKDKMGFVSPDAAWILENKEEVRTELYNIISEYTIFNKNIIARFDKFCNGQLEYDPLFFRVISFAKFCRIFKMKEI